MERRMYKTVCSNCDDDTEVPFKPDGKRPVYCQQCLRRNRTRKFFENNKKSGGRKMFRKEEEEEDWDDDY